MFISFIKRFVLVFVFAGLWVSGASAQGLDNRLTENTQEKKTKKYSGLLMALHFSGFGDQRNEPSTLFIGQVNYKYKSWTLFASQFMQKLYYLNDSNENEVLFYDTWLGGMRGGKLSFLGGRYSLRARVTLPVSEYSIRNDIITKPDVRLRNSWAFLDNKLSLSLGLEGTLYVNAYTTTQTGPRDGGQGMPMPLARLSFQSLANYQISDKLSASAYAFFLRRQYERLGPGNQVSDGNVPTHDFWYGVSMSYQLRKKLGLYAGFDHSNTLEQHGRVEFYGFDPISSQWSLGANYIF